MTSLFRSERRQRSTCHVEARFWVCLLLGSVLYFIAGSIGSGWMFLLSSAVIAALFCGWLWPLMALRNIVVVQRPVQSATDGEPILIHIDIFAGKSGFVQSLFPACLLLIDHRWPNDQGNKRKSTISYDAMIENVGGRVDLPDVVALQKPGLPRGVHKSGEVVLRTAFPLGLTWHERAVPSQETITVYPRTHPMEGFFLYRIKAIGSGAFGLPKDGTSAQSIFTRSVRNYVRGDSPRSIHWMSTARMGRLMVREYDAEGLPYFDVALDLSAPWYSAQQFELAVATVASLIELGQRMGLNPELRLFPDLNELTFNLPPVFPGFEMQMEILARIMPLNVPAETRLRNRHFSGPHSAEEKALVIVAPEGEVTFSSSNSFIVEISKLARVSTPYSSDGRSSLDAAAVTGNRALITRLEDVALL